MKKTLLLLLLAVPCLAHEPFYDNNGINPFVLDNTISDIERGKLDVTKASSTYVTKEGASGTYLTKSSASATYANYGTTEELYLRKSSSTATYATKNFMSSYAAKSVNTKYEATTDGMVAVFIECITASDLGTAVLLIGSSADIDAGNYATCSDSAYNTSTIAYGGFSCAVNKGQFWKVVATTADGGAVTACWISFGN